MNNSSNTNNNNEKQYSSSKDNNLTNTNTNLNISNVANSVRDDELLRAYIGDNYEKITNKRFNFAGFFFTTFYMFYRKMFLYGILLFFVYLVLSNFMKNIIIIILLGIVAGLFVNKAYIHHANKKIAKIKLQNQQKDISELKSICSTKGGTSIGRIFCGLLAELSIIYAIAMILIATGVVWVKGNFFNPNNWYVIIKSYESDIDNSDLSKNEMLVEDVRVLGSSYFETRLGKKYTIQIKESNISNEYIVNDSIFEVFKFLGGYNSYIKVDIYYTQKGQEKTIVDYKIVSKSNNEDISNVKTENELREKIGLYSIGTHTDSLILSKIGMDGAGINDDTTYTYRTYIFKDNTNNEYEMKYINPDGKLNLVEGEKYSVTFEISKDTFGDEYIIKSIN